MPEVQARPFKRKNPGTKQKDAKKPVCPPSPMTKDVTLPVWGYNTSIAGILKPQGFQGNIIRPGIIL